MTSLELSTTFVIVMLLLVLSEPLAKLTRLPRGTLQLILGAGATTAIVAAGFDTGLRYQNFHDLVFYVFLPVLIFEAAYAIDVPALKRVLLPVLSLAVLGLLGTCALVAVGLYYGIGHTSGFPWIAALLTGTLLAATDPAAVTSQLSGGSRLALLLEGESLFNDATAVVLFTLMLTAALALLDTGAANEAPTFLSGLWLFVEEFFGGALVGAAVGAAATFATRRIDDAAARHWLGLAAAFGAYLGALALELSGAMGCLVTGLIMGYRAERSAPIWHVLGQTSSGVLFLLMGATLQANMFSERWLAMLIAIGAVFIARALVLQATLAATNFASPADAQFRPRERLAAGALGMRGAITLALALTLPTELPYWWTIQSIAYGVVLFDMCLIAPLVPWITRAASR